MFNKNNLKEEEKHPLAGVLEDKTPENVKQK